MAKCEWMYTQLINAVSNNGWDTEFRCDAAKGLGNSVMFVPWSH
jgi:hypothetical protein